MNLTDFQDLLRRGVVDGYGSNPVKVRLPDGRLLDVSDVAIQWPEDPDDPADIAIVVRS